MANKGPIKANRNTSHFTAILIVHFIRLTCSLQCMITTFEDFAALRIMFSSLHDPRARSINLLERFFSLSIAFISVSQMVSELLKYITIRVISESLECRWRRQRHGKTQKTQKGKEKARKAIQVRYTPGYTSIVRIHNTRSASKTIRFFHHRRPHS